MQPGKSTIPQSEIQKIYEFFVEVKSKLRDVPIDPEIEVIGFADKSGGKSYNNQKLADSRAKRVKDFIEETYSGNPEKKTQGLKVARAIGKAEGHVYDGVVNKFGMTSTLIIFRQGVDNYPIEIADVYGVQIDGFNNLDQKSDKMSYQIYGLNESVKETNQIIRNDKKLASAIHEADKIIQNRLLVFMILGAFTAIIAIILLIWPKSKVIIDNSDVAENMSEIRHRIQSTENIISSSSSSVGEKVDKVALSVQKMEEKITNLKPEEIKTNQKSAEVRNMVYNGKTYIVHLENQNGLLVSPFRRPKVEGHGDFVSFFTMKTSQGGNKQIARIFMRAQRAKNVDGKTQWSKSDVNQHWKDQIEHLINNPTFTGPRLIQQG